MFNKMMVEDYVQQNDGGKVCATKWWWKIRFNKMMVEKIKQIYGRILGYNKMRVKIYVQQNDGG